MEKKLAELLEEVKSLKKQGQVRSPEPGGRTITRMGTGAGFAARPSRFTSGLDRRAGPHAADQALEVIALEARGRDRMVRRLAACSRIWIGRPRVLGDLADHLGEQPAGRPAPSRSMWRGCRPAPGREIAARFSRRYPLSAASTSRAWRAYLGGSQITTSNRSPWSFSRSRTFEHVAGLERRACPGRSAPRCAGPARSPGPSCRCPGSTWPVRASGRSG